MNTEAFLQILVPVLVLAGAYAVGSHLEKRHFQNLRARENASRRFLTVNFPYVPPETDVVEVTLVTGSVVVSIDYFKRFLAGLRMLFGGRITSYEPVLDRGRREAIMRMKEEARRLGYHALTNVRLETSSIARSGGSNKGTAGVEILAYGTALKLSR
jgi:uncharacterized protein YbjQ (UPF0145 family)